MNGRRTGARGQAATHTSALHYQLTVYRLDAPSGGSFLDIPDDSAPDPDMEDDRVEAVIAASVVAAQPDDRLISDSEGRQLVGAAGKYLILARAEHWPLLGPGRRVVTQIGSDAPPLFMRINSYRHFDRSGLWIQCEATAIEAQQRQVG